MDTTPTCRDRVESVPDYVDGIAAFLVYLRSPKSKTMQFTLTCRDEDGTMTRKQFDSVYLSDVVDKTQDFLKGVGFCFEELHTQVYPVPETEEDEYRSIYKDVD